MGRTLDSHSGCLQIPASTIMDTGKEAEASFVGFSSDTAPLSPKPCKELTHYYFCKNCGKVHSKTYTCNERYGRCCYPERKKRNYARLMDLKIKSRRLIHIIIGFKKSSVLPNKIKKRDMEKNLTRLHNRIRKKLKLQFNGVRIFDLADNGCYEHYHYAVVPESLMMNGRSLQIDVKTIKRELKTVTHSESEVVKVVGFRNKGSLFYYFSKRISGCYGHKKKTFFLEDVMEYQTYYTQFFNVRSLVKIGFPEGISCSNALSPHVCPYCGSEELYLVDILPTGESYKPPPWLENVIDDIKHDTLRVFF